MKEGPRHRSYREDRMVWAFDTTHGALVRIGVGRADDLRRRAQQGELVCPASDCVSPALTTRRGYTLGSGTFVPDGFRHVVAPNPRHEPESHLHITGKLVVAEWLMRGGWQDVQLERRDTQAGRTPDVTATRARAVWPSRFSTRRSVQSSGRPEQMLSQVPGSR